MMFTHSRSMAASLGLAALLAAISSNGATAEPSNTLDSREIAEGWIQLFDGTSLYGWKASSKADWRVEDGVITASQGEPGLLHTTSQFGNYVLKVDFRTAKGTNSGVFLRTSPNPGPKEVGRKCYEVNIADSHENEYPTGSIVQRQKVQGVHDSTDWQTMEITADGGHLVVSLDGRVVCEDKVPKPLGRGYIGLQFRSGKIEFRNIKLKPLGAKSLFNGKDLAGWKTYPNMASVFTVTPEGWLHVKNGRGQLETQESYGDFTLQLEVFVNGKGLNSGVFYRSIPGETMNGYECQIQNAFNDNDRTKPVDCGTGGIFRQQNARRVVADDLRWFTLTLHVDGSHVATWVDGYQVCDWSDHRRANKNPRKGLRLEPGTIQLQGHDATTDLSFRNLRLAPLAVR